MRGRPKVLTIKEQFELRLSKEAGFSVKQSCSYFGISRTTYFEYMSQMRKRMGPEKAKEPRKQRWHLFGTNRPENMRTSAPQHD